MIMIGEIRDSEAARMAVRSALTGHLVVTSLHSFSCTGAIERMIDLGVPESQLLTVGLGYVDDPFVRGRDLDSTGRQIETEAAKNRRVVVLDADSETARKILKTD